MDNFLKTLSTYFELVIFSRCFNDFKDPKLKKIDVNHRIINKIDPNHYISKRLFREHCSFSADGTLTQDMTRIGRALDDAIILDNRPLVYMMQPDMGIPI